MKRLNPQNFNNKTRLALLKIPSYKETSQSRYTSATPLQTSPFGSSSENSLINNLYKSLFIQSDDSLERRENFLWGLVGRSQPPTTTTHLSLPTWYAGASKKLEAAMTEFEVGFTDYTDNSYLLQVNGKLLTLRIIQWGLVPYD